MTETRAAKRRCGEIVDGWKVRNDATTDLSIWKATLPNYKFLKQHQCDVASTVFFAPQQAVLENGWNLLVGIPQQRMHRHKVRVNVVKLFQKNTTFNPHKQKHIYSCFVMFFGPCICPTLFQDGDIKSTIGHPTAPLNYCMSLVVAEHDLQFSTCTVSHLFAPKITRSFTLPKTILSSEKHRPQKRTIPKITKTKAIKQMKQKTVKKTIQHHLRKKTSTETQKNCI